MGSKLPFFLVGDVAYISKICVTSKVKKLDWFFVMAIKWVIEYRKLTNVYCNSITLFVLTLGL